MFCDDKCMVLNVLTPIWAAGHSRVFESSCEDINARGNALTELSQNDENEIKKIILNSDSFSIMFNGFAFYGYAKLARDRKNLFIETTVIDLPFCEYLDSQVNDYFNGKHDCSNQADKAYDYAYNKLRPYYERLDNGLADITRVSQNVLIDLTSFHAPLDFSFIKNTVAELYEMASKKTDELFDTMTKRINDSINEFLMKGDN